MGLSTLFGRNVSARERRHGGLKYVRHNGRAQRLSFGRQLRTLMCFTTEEKLSRGGGSGDKICAKSGSLSQRLRLSESCEDQSGPSQLESLSGLTVRPSTCPPPGLADETALSDKPSSFALSSLNEEQLNAYLNVLFNRCAMEERSRGIARKGKKDVDDNGIESEDRLEGATSSAADDIAKENACSAMVESSKPLHRPTRRECEELIRRHEQMFGPIVTSRPPPLGSWSTEPSEPPAQVELCQPPPAPEPAYLRIPRHQEPCAGPEWDEWRQHYSTSTPDTWRIVRQEEPATGETAAAEANEKPRSRSAEPHRRRLLGTLRRKCASLFRLNHKDHALASVPVPDPSMELDSNPADGQESAEEIGEKILSETKADDVLKDKDDLQQTLCTTYEELNALTPEQPRHDSKAYRDGAFWPWRRFFSRPVPGGPPFETSTPEQLQQAEAIASEAGAGPDAAQTTSDGLPASLWWGVSPILEPVERAGDASRLPVLLEQLRPASVQRPHSGLARLVERLDAPPPPADRRALWLSMPELPQLFAAAGLGPDDMTRWVFCVPPEREDDAVPMRPDTAEQQQRTEGVNTSPESGDQATSKTTTPRAKFFEELMGVEPSELCVQSSAVLNDEPATTQANVEEHILQETKTTDLATPATEFASGWGAPSKTTASDNTDTLPAEKLISIDISAPAGSMFPMCSDVCTFLLPEHQGSAAEQSRARPVAAPDAKQPYEMYGTDQWKQLGAPKPVRRRAPPVPAAAVAQAAATAQDSAPRGEPVGRFDSETEMGACLSEASRAASAAADSHQSLLRNSSMRPIDSEVDIAQVLYEQSSYATLEQPTSAPASSGYLALPMHEVDSETEIGLALPPADGERALSDSEHRRVTAYDSETEVGALMTSLHATDSETEMGERLRRLHEDEASRQQEQRRRAATPSSSMTRLPPAPVQVDSETEMGVVLKLFEQGMLSSRYFAGVPLSDEPDSSDPFASACHRSDSPEAAERPFVDPAISIDEIYNVSKELSKKVINKTLFLLGSDPLVRPLNRTSSSPFGPSSGFDGIELEREAAADDGSRLDALSEEGGECDPQRVIPEVRLTTSDGSLVVLFPCRPADTADTTYHETDEGLVLRLQKRQQPRAAAESRGFQPTEAGLSHSERELSGPRRLIADRCADAALRRRSPSPRGARSSEDGGLRVLYRADGAEPVSPEGLSGLSLSPTDPELAALRWRKNCRGEDGDQETMSAGGEAAPPPPAQSQSQTELRKEKPESPTAVGVNSWC